MGEKIRNQSIYDVQIKNPVQENLMAELCSHIFFFLAPFRLL